LPICVLSARDEIETTRGPGLGPPAPTRLRRETVLRRRVGRPLHALVKLHRRSDTAARRSETWLSSRIGARLPVAAANWSSQRASSTCSTRWPPPGPVLSREQLLEHVWGLHLNVDTNVVDVFVATCGAKLEERRPDADAAHRPGVGFVLRP